MSFVDRSNRYSYMPVGSYAVLPDGSPLFLVELPEEMKERFARDLKDEQAERDALIADPKAYIW